MIHRSTTYGGAANREHNVRFPLAARLTLTVGLVMAIALFYPSPADAAGPVASSPVSPAATAQLRTSGKIPLLPRAEARSRPKLRMGSTGIWVKRVQEALRSRPYDGHFGRKTGKSVKKFRKRHGLRPRRKVNTRTWRHLGKKVIVPVTDPKPATPTPPPSNTAFPNLRRGQVSVWVRALQLALNIASDGVFGPGTESSVKQFQRGHGQTPTGLVDRATWQALGSRVIPPQPDPTITLATYESPDHRAKLGVSAFRASPTARRVVQRESHGNCTAVNPTGKYRGAWQMDANFWSNNGGLTYAKRADLATCAQQDQVAFNGWVSRWWRPWPTAG